MLMDLLDLSENPRIQMLGPNQLQEGLMNVTGGDHRPVCPNPPPTHRGGFFQTNSHRPSIIDENLFDGAACAYHRSLVHRTTVDGVEIPMHPGAGIASTAGVGEGEELNTVQGRYRHPLPVGSIGSH